MSAFRSNLNSINNNVLKFARHNDAHSDDALEILLTNIYTAVPAAIIVESGVNYRTSTTDFQAWAIYYDPNQILNPAALNNLEIIAQFQPLDDVAYAGTYEVYNDAGLGFGGTNEYLVITSVDYQNTTVRPVINVANPLTTGQNINDVLNDIGIQNFILNSDNNFTIKWENSGVYSTNFSRGNNNTFLCSYGTIPSPLGQGVCVIDFPFGATVTGQPIPALATTGRWQILITDYNL
jgi:hypothetical protein